MLPTDVETIVLCRVADLTADPETDLRVSVLSVTGTRVADPVTADPVWVASEDSVIRTRMTIQGVHSLQSVLPSPAPTAS